MKKNLSKWIALLLLSTISFSNAFAQNKTITGVVKDEKGTTLPGASVTETDSKKAAMTDVNGKFSISVPSKTRSLEISFVGMETETVSVGNKAVVNVTLKSVATAMTDVVVIGYGTVQRSKVTSSISSVSEQEIKNLPVSGADQAIQGKVAGVTVNNNGGQPGGGVSVRIRGITSVNANEPLYVIDGVPMAAQINSLEQNVLGGGSGQTAQSVLSTLNPNDIESIDILKDASAQAIYGSRAANGVVLINTKKGKSGKGKITYDTYFGRQEIAKKLPVMNLQEYAGYLNSLVLEVRAAGSGMDSTAEFRNPSILGKGTDWQDEIYQTGLMQNHQLSFSGGEGKTNYYFSGNYFKQEGTLLKTSFQRYAFRMNIDQQVKSWAKAGISANLSRGNQNIGLTDAFDAVTSVVLYNSPASPVTDVWGSFISNSIIGGQTFGNPNNPVALSSLRDIRAVSSRAFGAVYVDLKLYKGLSMRNEFNYDYAVQQNKAYQPFLKNDSTGAIIMSPSRLRERRNNSLYWALKNYLNYDRQIGKNHWIYVTAGHEAQGSNWDYIQAKRDNLTNNLPSLNAGAGGNGSGETIEAGAGEWAMESVFGRLNYSFSNRYNLSVTYRADGSSSFGSDKRWGQFKGASVAWTVTNEKFGNIKYVNFLKVRFGAGQVGNQNVGANLYSANINLYANGPFGGGGLPRNVPNPKLGWETVTTYNGGIDAALLNKRIELTFDVYKKVTTDMFLPSQLGAFSGLGTAWNDIWTPTTNDGEMTNTGFDITLTTNNINRKDLTWKTTFIFSHYKNILNRLNTPEATIKGELDEYGTKSLLTLTKAGQPVGAYYGYVTDGIFKTMAELNNGTDWGLGVAPNRYWLGDIRYKDLNGDKKIDDKDVTFLGSPNPKFTYGMTNSVSYKGFDLSVFLYGSYGAKIFNYTRRQTEAMTSAWSNQLSTVLDRYTPANPGATMPRYNQWHDNNRRISDRYIEDGSYLRIQNVSLGYNVPAKWMSKTKVVSNARIYFSVQNLYTFTKYSGYDPELGAYNNNVIFMNVDNGHYPVPRTLTLGANIEL